MKKNIQPPEEDFKIRCPKLGHNVPFSYCMRENNGLPCRKALDCWHLYFSVYEFFKETLSPEEWQKAFESGQKPKVVSLVELIQKAKKSNHSGDS